MCLINVDLFFFCVLYLHVSSHAFVHSVHLHEFTGFLKMLQDFSSVEILSLTPVPVWMCDTYRQFLDTSRGCLGIQLNFDTVYLEIASGSTGLTLCPISDTDLKPQTSLRHYLGLWPTSYIDFRCSLEIARNIFVKINITFWLFFQTGTQIRKHGYSLYHPY